MGFKCHNQGSMGKTQKKNQVAWRGVICESLFFTSHLGLSHIESFVNWNITSELHIQVLGELTRDGHVLANLWLVPVRGSLGCSNHKT